MYFDEHQLRRTFIFYKVIDITFKYKKIVGWIIMIEEQLMKYKYVFAWNYKELKFIPRKLYEHKIELMVDV